MSKPRGLCWKCYDNLEIRNLYPITSKYARRGVGSKPSPKPASAPCLFGPGTREKADEMARRLEAGEMLHHPDDAKENRGDQFSRWTGRRKRADAQEEPAALESDSEAEDMREGLEEAD